MKKIAAILLCVVFAVSFAACQKELTPVEKLDQYITENGVQDGEQYVLECPEAIGKIKESSFTIAHMENLKGSAKTEFKIIKSADGISLELVDSSITDNGLKMERTVSISPDGTFQYYNGVIMNGVDLGVRLGGEIPMDTYSKANTPVITSSEFASGAKMSDAVKNALKEYIDLTLDCYVMVLSQEALGITPADVGYAAYPGNE